MSRSRMNKEVQLKCDSSACVPCAKAAKDLLYNFELQVALAQFDFRTEMFQVLSDRITLDADPIGVKGDYSQPNNVGAFLKQALEQCTDVNDLQYIYDHWEDFIDCGLLSSGDCTYKNKIKDKNDTKKLIQNIYERIRETEKGPKYVNRVRKLLYVIAYMVSKSGMSVIKKEERKKKNSSIKKWFSSLFGGKKEQKKEESEATESDDDTNEKQKSKKENEDNAEHETVLIFDEKEVKEFTKELHNDIVNDIATSFQLTVDEEDEVMMKYRHHMKLSFLLTVLKHLDKKVYHECMEALTKWVPLKARHDWHHSGISIKDFDFENTFVENVITQKSIGILNDIFALQDVLHKYDTSNQHKLVSEAIDLVKTTATQTIMNRMSA